MAEVVSMDKIRATAGRLNIDLSTVDLDSIRLPSGEDFGVISDDEDLKEEDPLEFDAGFGNIIVVDNLPVVPKEKFEKLEGVIRKIYSQIGVIKEDGLWMPVDPETQKSLGYCFIEYNTLQFWTESFVQWSPLRTYMATVHRQGAQVWGGATTFNRLTRYAHPEVSPGEKFSVTYSSHEPSNPHDTDRVVINVLDVRTGKVMRDFKGSADEFAI